MGWMIGARGRANKEDTVRRVVRPLGRRVQCVSFRPVQDEDQRQVQGCLFRSSETRAGEGVPLQQVHHDQAKGGIGASVGALRETGTKTVATNAVSETAILKSFLQVKIWFQNRRAKDRKQTKKRDEVFERGKHEMVANINAAAAAQMFGMPPSHAHPLLPGEHNAPLPPPSPFYVGM